MRTRIRTLMALGIATVVLLGGVWRLADSAGQATAQADPGEVLHQGIDAFNRGDVDAVTDLYAGDAVFAGIVPCAPVQCAGKGAIQNAVEFYVADNIRITIVSSEVSGNTVTGSAEIESDMVRAAGVERFVASYRVEVRGGSISRQRFDFDVGDSQTSAFLTYVGANTVAVQLGTGRAMDQIPGWAQLMGFGDRTAVAVSLARPGPADVGKPVNVHEGACADLGAVAFPLQDAKGGISAMVLDVPLSELQAGSLAISIQQSRDEPDTYEACGDIPVAAEEEGPTSTAQDTALKPTSTPEEVAVEPTDGGRDGRPEDGGDLSTWWYALAAGVGLLVLIGLGALIRARSRGAAGE